MNTSSSKPKLIMTWWAPPRLVAKAFGYRRPLPLRDWVSLKKWPWGEMGYKHEDGIKFITDLTKAALREVLAIVIDFHRQHDLPYTFSGHSLDGQSYFEAQASDNRDIKGLCEDTPLHRNKVFGIVYELI